MDRYVIDTGLSALDDLVPRWPGVTLFLGYRARAREVLAAQIALKTAWAGRPVLWLCAGGTPEHALLIMMTRLAKIERGRVFTTRDLNPAEWRRLEAAASRVSKLPIRFGDAHGADGLEIEGAFCRSVVEGQEEHRLVVIDRLDGAPKELLRHLERLSDLVKVPFLLLVDHLRTDPREPLSTHECGLRPGSRLVFLEPAPSRDSLSPRARPGPRDWRIEITRVGARSGYRRFDVSYDAVRQRFGEPATSGGPRRDAP